MSAHSRRKGRRGENELAALIGARRISEAGSPGPDLDWNGRTVECKRRQAGAFTLLYRWLENAQVLAVRADRKDWLVVMPVDELLDLLDEARRSR